MTKPKPKPGREKPTADAAKSAAVAYVKGKWAQGKPVPPPGSENGE